MPKVLCPHSGCKYNASNTISTPGRCQYNGTITLVQGEYAAEDFMDCMNFKSKPLEQMVDRRLGYASKMVSMS